MWRVPLVPSIIPLRATIRYPVWRASMAKPLLIFADLTRKSMPSPNCRKGPSFVSNPNGELPVILSNRTYFTELTGKFPIRCCADTRQTQHGEFHREPT
ncbi:hypothetical protein RvY_04140 [Ramazzottius varieornatus]|uniref:Uncharacterized protein n=1 Tax=Ramazzottius varieornatus TaxID=947166 RepID=A0A1D1UXG9_RAMVA|nr:hypothetical protein RvY_04140 [Ramazzottius varieornatus]